MTLSSPTVRHASAAVLALAYTALTFGAVATPSPAEARGAAYYTAELAAPAAERTNISGGVAWLCDGATCAADKGRSRPVIMCQRLVRDLGEVKSFTADGKAFEQDDLARCNGK